MHTFLSFFLPKFESIDPDAVAYAAKTYKKLFLEGVATDVNPANHVPSNPGCVDGVNPNEYFDKQTVSDEQMERTALARMGARNVVAPSAGRTSLGISGNCRTAENCCADCSSGT